MENRTFTGKTVDEATGTALKSLGVELEDVDIKVVSPGRSGILGLGGAPAMIEVRLIKRPDTAPQREPRPPREMPQPRERDRDRDREPARDRQQAQEPVTQAPASPAQVQAQPPAPAGEPAQSDRRQDRGPRRRPNTRRRQPENRSGDAGLTPVPPGDVQPRIIPATAHLPRGEAPARTPVHMQGPAAGQAEPRAMAGPATEEEMAAEQDYPEAPPTVRDAEAEEMIAKLLDFFLASMGVVAETFVRDELDSGSLVFEIEGPDAGLLIGRRGETLQALQFAVRMVTNRQLGRKCYVIIDVEGYRERRSEMLQRLARRTAGRVATMGRSASLEPMTPAERRIIHMTLADHPRVRTESEGEGNRRHVVVLPKRAGGRPSRDEGDSQVQATGQAPGQAEGQAQPEGRGGFRGRRMRRPYDQRRQGADMAPGEAGPPAQSESPAGEGPDSSGAPVDEQRPSAADMPPPAEPDREGPGEAR